MPGLDDTGRHSASAARPAPAPAAALGRGHLLRAAAIPAEVLEVAELANSGEHLGGDDLGLERSVLHDPRVDARGPALADRRAGDGVLGLAVPVQRVIADVGHAHGRYYSVPCGCSADVAEDVS